MRRRLNTSTAVIASLSLLAGGPAFPQEAAPADRPMVCADGSDRPCPEGVPLVPAPEDAAPEDASQAAPGAEPASDVAPVPEAGPAPEPAPEPAPQPAPEPAPEVAPEPEPAPEAAPEAASEAAPEAVPAEPEAAPEAASEAPLEPEAAPDAQPEVAPEVAPDAAPEAVTPEPAPEPAPEAVIPEEIAPPAPAPAAAAPLPETPGSETPGPDATGPDATGAGVTGAGSPPALPVQPDAASGEPPVAAAAQIEPGAEPPADAEVTEEIVTEDTARSSAEDFANPVGQPAAPQAASQTAGQAAPAASTTANDKGLSDAEKAVLLGLGALAVGAILSNNRRVELNSGDRVVVQQPDGSYRIIKDDNVLLRRPGSTVRTERYDDGSTRTTVSRADGSQVVTIRDAGYRVLRRVHVAPDGRQTLLLDDTVEYRPVDVTRLPPPAPVIEVDPAAGEAALRAVLGRQARTDRAFSLAQVRDIERVRALVPVIDLTAITFETGSAAIRPDQAEALSRIGALMKDYIGANPREMFLIEGHTDAVGSAAANLALSDRRAESVALALTEYFDVPPENMVVQGYGEEFLKVPTDGPERQNRRASVRRITDLLRAAAN